MALIPSKARAGLAALTFAAAMAPIILAIPAKAITIGFSDVLEDMPPQLSGHKPAAFAAMHGPESL
jgi:hypothetical protein